MGFCVEEDVLPCPCRNHLLQHPANADIVYTGIELSIGKCSRTALTELHICGGVQLAGLKEAAYLLVPGLGILTPFQHQRSQTCLGKEQRGKHTRRTKAHHHRALRKFPRASGWLIIGNGSDGCPLAAALL